MPRIYLSPSHITSDDRTLVTEDFHLTLELNPLLYQHARPILTDSERVTWSMYPEQLEEVAGIVRATGTTR